MKKILFLLLFFLVLPCTAGKKNDFVPQKDSLVNATQITNLNWKVMGFCDSTSQICIYIDTLLGYIVQLRRLKKTQFTVRDIDKPVAVNKLVEGAYCTSKFLRRLKLVSKNPFTITYKAKRGRMIIEVNPDNKRIKNITIKK